MILPIFYRVFKNAGGMKHDIAFLLLGVYNPAAFCKCLF